VVCANAEPDRMVGTYAEPNHHLCSGRGSHHCSKLRPNYIPNRSTDEWSDNQATNTGTHQGTNYMDRANAEPDRMVGTSYAAPNGMVSPDSAPNRVVSPDSAPNRVVGTNAKPDHHICSGRGPHHCSH
jgi:hypothetical protein